jgi:TatD DNase family protein
MTYFDSHAHLTSTADPAISQILARSQAVGVSHILNICTTLESLDRGLALSQQFPHIYNAAATTPHDVEALGEKEFHSIAAHAKAGHLAAIGETGLDYHYLHSPREQQQHFLRRYLQLALECQLPIIIHCREAFDDLFHILDEDYRVGSQYAPGVLHCFTGTLKEAQEVVKHGWFLSLSGIVTFKKSMELREVARWMPLEQLLIETDSPYLAPQSKRGHPNEPSYLPETAATIASVKGLSLEEVARATFNNAKKLFNIL